jgi:hypothetical protein
VGLIHLGQWADARCFEHIPFLKKLAHMLLETIRYLVDRLQNNIAIQRVVL